MKIERVVVTGGRHFHNVQRVLADLRALQVAGLVAVAQGGAAGADACARNSCDVLKIHWQTYPALWDRDGRGAGPRRNIRMLESERPDIVLAYPDPNSRGTWHCVREALQRGIPAVVWAPWAGAAAVVISAVAQKPQADDARRFVFMPQRFKPTEVEALTQQLDARRLAEVLHGHRLLFGRHL